MAKSNLKVVEQREQMSFRQVEKFAHDLAELLMDADDEVAKALLVIFEEIGHHSFDQSHVEGITIQMRDYIFMMCVGHSDAAERRVIETTRRKWVSDEAS